MKCRAMLVSLLLCACTDPVFPCDGGRVVAEGGDPRCVHDAGETDAGRDDAGPRDGGTRDGGPRDAGRDAGGDAGGGAEDAGLFDGGATDGGGGAPTEAPDCLDEADCPRHGPAVLDLTTTSERIYVDEIDGDDHVIPTVACGPVTAADRDVVSILAPVRSIVEVIVERDTGGALEPVLETFDESALFIMTYAAGATRARTMFVQHAPAPEATHVMVHHLDAYQSLCTGPPISFRGGDAYGYRLTARVCDGCVVEDLGTLTAPATVTATLTEPGDVHVVRFVADPGATPTVSFAGGDVACPSALGGGCCPIAVPLHPGDDGAPRASYTDTARSVAQCESDSRGFPPSNDAGERLLAIYDYEGLGAAGYTLEVTITP